MKYLICLTIIFVCQLLHAQDTESLLKTDTTKIQQSNYLISLDSSLKGKSNSDSSNLTFIHDEHFEMLLQSYLEQKKVQGFKIQLYAGNKKIEAIKMKAEFMKKYEEVSPTIIYQQPNFKVRVGNYRNRLEATKFLEIYKIDFPSSFIVQDAIEIIK